MHTIFIKIIVIIFLATAITSCSQISAYSRSTSHFKSFEKDQRIYYENGALDLALQIYPYLGNIVKNVEIMQYSKFCREIKIYICEDKESFSCFTGLSPKAKAAVFNGNVFISPILREQPERIVSITTHELSHLHFIHKIGTWKFLRHIPSWFSEGLAVVVSNGGGAETVTENEAAAAIREGNVFAPDNSGSFIFPKTASSYGLKPHMFYRQSSIFVRFLMQHDGEKFKSLLESIQNGKKFHDAFQASYGGKLDDYWYMFKKKIGDTESIG